MRTCCYCCCCCCCGSGGGSFLSIKIARRSGGGNEASRRIAECFFFLLHLENVRRKRARVDNRALNEHAFSVLIFRRRVNRRFHSRHRDSTDSRPKAAQELSNPIPRIICDAVLGNCRLILGLGPSRTRNIKSSGHICRRLL